MGNKHLKAYVEQKNRVRRMFGKPELDPGNLARSDIDELLVSIEADLSPENLTMDGELRGAKLRARSAMINGARSELEAMR